MSQAFQMKMPVVSLATVVFSLLGGALMGPTAAVAQSPELGVLVDQSETSVVLGDSLDLTVVVTNNGPSPTERLVVHIDVVDPAHASSVDPEDWTATLSKPVGALAPGASRTVDWSIQPIAGGQFILYAVVLSPVDQTIVVSNAVGVAVADHRSLNPQGILPLAVGAPLVVGLLLASRVRPRRRRPLKMAHAG